MQLHQNGWLFTNSDSINSSDRYFPSEFMRIMSNFIYILLSDQQVPFIYLLFTIDFENEVTEVEFGLGVFVFLENVLAVDLLCELEVVFA